MTYMKSEINEIPDILEHIYELKDTLLEDIVSAVKTKNLNNVAIIARGSSLNAGTFFKALVENYLGLPVSTPNLSTTSIYGKKINYTNTLMIAISQSGEGADVNEFCTINKNDSSYLVGFTNFPENSHLAQLCDKVVPLFCGEELSVAATKTLVSESYLLALLVSKLSEDEELINSLSKIPKAIKDTISSPPWQPRSNELIRNLSKKNSIIVLSRGIIRGFADEIALKLNETCYMNAQSYSIAEFMHGPLGILNQSIPVLCINSPDESGVSTSDYVKYRILNKKRILLSVDPSFKLNAKLFVPSSNIINYSFRVLVAMQLIIEEVSLLKGNDPDHPFNLNKITITK